MAFKMHIHRADVISGALSVYKAKLKSLVNLGCSHKPALFIAESSEAGSSLGLPSSRHLVKTGRGARRPRGKHTDRFPSGTEQAGG